MYDNQGKLATLSGSIGSTEGVLHSVDSLLTYVSFWADVSLRAFPASLPKILSIENARYGLQHLKLCWSTPLSGSVACLAIAYIHCIPVIAVVVCRVR